MLVRMATTRVPPGDVDDPLARRGARILIAVSLLACLVKILGAGLDIGWMAWAQWLYIPPLALALVLAGGLRDPRGRWWLAGLALSWVGDAFGGGDFLLLLGSFLVAHICYVVALWPTHARSQLARRGSAPYVLLGLAGAAALAPAAGAALAVPVVLYASALTLMAVLATAGGRAGAIGGLLFMVSDLALGLGMFVFDWPTAVQTTVVIGTYVPAQVLLLVALLRLSASGSRRSTV